MLTFYIKHGEMLDFSKLPIGHKKVNFQLNYVKYTVYLWKSFDAQIGIATNKIIVTDKTGIVDTTVIIPHKLFANVPLLS